MFVISKEIKEISKKEGIKMMGFLSPVLDSKMIFLIFKIFGFATTLTAEVEAK